MSRKFKSSLILVLALVLVMSSGGYAEGLVDVKSKDWYYKSVTELVTRGGISGYTDGTFKPSGTITFSEFLKMSMSSATGKEYPVQKGDHWASGVYEEAVRLGIIDGQEFPGITETLNKVITREDMTLILININLKIQGEEKVDTSNTASKIPDINKVSPARKEHVLQAYEKGLITGKPEGFVPQGKTTRAEAATVIVRMLDKEFRVETPDKPVVEAPTGGRVVDLSNPKRDRHIKSGDTVILPNGTKVVVKMGKNYLGEGQGLNMYDNLSSQDGSFKAGLGDTGISVYTKDVVSKEVIAKYKATGAELPNTLVGRYRQLKNGDYMMSDIRGIINQAYFMDLPDIDTQKIGDVSPCGFYKVVPHQAGGGRGTWEMQL